MIFKGKRRNRAGVYTQIISGIQNPALATSFGNLLVINTLSEPFFTGGSGINGTLNTAKKSQYTFSDIGSFQNWIGGGLWWFLATKLFSPGGGAASGVDSITYVDAATTVPATIPLLFGGQDVSDGDGISTDNSTLVVQVKAEGFAGNAVLGDEVRAQATITISNAGTTGNIINVKVGGVSIGAYTVQAGDNILAVVNGLAAAINAFGWSAVVSTTSTQIVIYAPSGSGASRNGSSPTILVTGGVVGATTTFSGGVEGTELTRGYAAQIIPGVQDPTKYIVVFSRGTYKGTDAYINLGVAKPLDSLSELSCVPVTLAISPEVSTAAQLVTWMQDAAGTGYAFNQYFVLQTATLGTSSSAILVSDLVQGTKWVKGAGGSSSFSITDLTAALSSLSGLTFDFVLCDQFGGNANSAVNVAIQAWANAQVNITPDVYIGGGSQIGEFQTLGITLAQSFNDNAVTLVFGGSYRTDIGGQTFRKYTSLYTAACVVGREAGLDPQDPLTLKNIGVDGLVAPLSEPQITAGIDAGVLMLNDEDGFQVERGINTLQTSSFLINPDGTSFSKQFTRIERQLNKLFVINGKLLFKKPGGANRANLSVAFVKTWAENLLQQQVDTLIVNYSGVTPVISADVISLTYNFVPDNEISFLISTGCAISA